MQSSLSAILIMIFILIYFFLVNVYSVLFRITGMTKEKAKFQVISLLTGCGYTTSESEIVTNDLFRRKIAKACMLTGYAFSVIIVTLIINLILSLKNQEQEHAFELIFIAFLAFLIIIFVFKIPFIEKGFTTFIEKLSSKLLNRGKHDNIITILDNYGKDAICEIYVKNLPKNLTDVSISESKIKERYNLNIMFVKRKGRVIDVTKDTMIEVKDHIIIFGNQKKIEDLFLHNDFKEKHQNKNKSANIIELIDNFHSDCMVEVKINEVPKILQNTTLMSSSLRDIYNINVLMIKEDNEIIPVTKDTIIKKGQTLILFGPYNHIKKIFMN